MIDGKASGYMCAYSAINGVGNLSCTQILRLPGNLPLMHLRLPATVGTVTITDTPVKVPCCGSPSLTQLMREWGMGSPENWGGSYVQGDCGAIEAIYSGSLCSH